MITVDTPNLDVIKTELNIRDHFNANDISWQVTSSSLSGTIIDYIDRSMGNPVLLRIVVDKDKVLIVGSPDVLAENMHSKIWNLLSFIYDDMGYDE